MESLHLDEPDAYVRYLDFPGADPPLVFIHGMGCASTIDYPRVIVHPALPRRRFVLPDLLGHGYSDAPSDFSYSVEAHAGTVAVLLDHLSIRSAVVVGHSMGGSVAVMLATARPDLVSRLLLSESNLDPGGGDTSRAIASQTEEDFIKRGHTALLGQLSSDGEVSRVATFRATNSRAFYLSAVSLVAGTTPTWRERFYALKIPKAWLVGEESAPENDIAKMKPQDIPVFVIPNAGHNMAFENPNGVAEAIAQGLRIAPTEA